MRGVGRGFDVAVELEEGREEREDEGEGYLWRLLLALGPYAPFRTVEGGQLTKSRSRETKMTLSTRFRVAASTGGAMAVAVGRVVEKVGNKKDADQNRRTEQDSSSVKAEEARDKK